MHQTLYATACWSSRVTSSRSRHGLDGAIPMFLGWRDGGSIGRERAAARLCWRQHSLENDFDELLGKGQPRYADQIASALRPRLGVGFFAHLARDCKRLIDIDDI